MRALTIYIFVGIILIGFMAFFALSFNVMAASGSEPISTFEVDIYGPPVARIEIQVPDRIDLGNLSYNSYSDDFKVEINNSGNVNINVRPVLVTSDDIFKNLYFRKRTSGNESIFTKVGDWSMNITAPTGSVREDWFYARLDLRDYAGSITRDMLSQEANVKFIATPA